MTSAEELRAFQPRFPFFVGIDYDGTIFDSMTVKHRDVFIPVFLDIWGAGQHKNELVRTWEKINLFSKDRGINRFAGLLKCFEAMYSITALPDFDSLRGFIASGKPLSSGGLKEYKAEYPSAFLEQVLEWSERSDSCFQKLMEGKPPFDNAREAIAQISAKADVMIISSASSRGVVKDLTNCALIELVSMVAGQEAGGKISQLKNGAAGKYANGKILMIGDSPGDREAAAAVNALFYPIIPSHEADSWKRFGSEGFDRFLSGGYAGWYEESLMDEFEKALAE